MDGKSLHSYYQTLFTMKFHYNFDIATMENMPVFELEYYSDLIQQELQRQKDESLGISYG